MLVQRNLFQIFFLLNNFLLSASLLIKVCPKYADAVARQWWNTAAAGSSFCWDTALRNNSSTSSLLLSTTRSSHAIKGRVFEIQRCLMFKKEALETKVCAGSLWLGRQSGCPRNQRVGGSNPASPASYSVVVSLGKTV